MSVRLRLQRHGRKRRPYYLIVATDQRNKRDGKYLQRLGSYDPTTVPASIDLDNDLAVDWLNKGAQPSDTVRAILRYRGVMFRRHLLRGVKKGALTMEEANAQYEAFCVKRDEKIQGHRDRVLEAAAKDQEKRIKAELEISNNRLKSRVPQEAVQTTSAPAAGGATEEAEAPAEQTIDDVARQADVETGRTEEGEAPAAETKAPEAAPAEEVAAPEAKAEEAPAEEAKPADEAPEEEAKAKE